MTGRRRDHLGTGQLRPDEVADALWLAVQIREAQGPPPAPPPRPPVDRTGPPEPPRPEPADSGGPDFTGGPVDPDPGMAEVSIETVGAAHLRSVTRRASNRWRGLPQLPDARGIVRALRPLTRTVSLKPAGRTTLRLGVARNVASCSIGWWVGPSSPRPIESWVKT